VKVGSGSTLSGNSASAGGGIYNNGSAAALTVSNSTFGSILGVPSPNTPDNIFGAWTDGGGNTFS
jgi:hypothetical protein